MHIINTLQNQIHVFTLTTCYDKITWKKTPNKISLILPNIRFVCATKPSPEIFNIVSYSLLSKLISWFSLKQFCFVLINFASCLRICQAKVIQSYLFQISLICVRALKRLSECLVVPFSAP